MRIHLKQAERLPTDRRSVFISAEDVYRERWLLLYLDAADVFLRCVSWVFFKKDKEQSVRAAPRL